MWNAGPVRARMIEIISPAGRLRNFFHELAEMIESDGQDLVESSALAGTYGLEFGQPEWLPGEILVG